MEKSPQEIAEMWRKQIAKEREDIAKYGFGGDGGINYPEDGTDYPKSDEEDQLVDIYSGTMNRELKSVGMSMRDFI